MVASGLRWVLLGLMIGPCGLAREVCHGADGAAGSRPNIIYLLADDLGYRDVGWRGGEIQTPNLDALAKTGARLETFYVQPVCSPTRAALLTGRYPFRYGLQVGVVRPWAQYGLPLEERTLPAALKDAGYATAICGKWHLGHFQPDYLPTRRGFDRQYGHYNGALDYFTHIRDGGFDWHRDDKVCRDEGYTTELVGREAAAIVKEFGKQQPFFLYVPFNAPHGPYQPPKNPRVAYENLAGNRRNFAQMVTALDDAVGQIIAALDEQGLRENTLILFSSDNGGVNPGRVADNTPLRAGKGTLYEGGVRAPAFAVWPGRIASATIHEPVHMVDWFPTLLKLAGAKSEQPLPLDGRDVWSVITEGAKTPHEEFVFNITASSSALRRGDWKLVVNGGRGVDEDADEADKPGPGKAELFNVVEDLSERTDRKAEQPEIVADLQRRLAEYARVAAPSPQRPAPKGFRAPQVWGE